jgi:muconolactone delta-isomerase
MTKAEIVDQIEFALSELADVRIELRRIREAHLETPRAGELYAETEARTLGRCQGMAENASMFLALAVENLRQCLSEPSKPIPAFFATRATITRTTHPDPAAQPNSTPEES